MLCFSLVNTVKCKEKEDGEKRFIDWEENGAMGHSQ